MREEKFTEMTIQSVSQKNNQIVLKLFLKSWIP